MDIRRTASVIKTWSLWISNRSDPIYKVVSSAPKWVLVTLFTTLWRHQIRNMDMPVTVPSKSQTQNYRNCSTDVFQQKTRNSVLPTDKVSTAEKVHWTVFCRARVRQYLDVIKIMGTIQDGQSTHESWNILMEDKKLLRRQQQQTTSCFRHSLAECSCVTYAYQSITNCP